MEKIENSEDTNPKLEQEENILRGLFRILTPDEIDFLCQMTDGMPKVPLTTLIEKELKNKTLTEKRSPLSTREDRRAKILPFKTIQQDKSEIYSKTAEVVETIPTLAEPTFAQELSSIPEKKLEGSELIFQKEQIIIEKKIDRIKFLLEQREKFRKHYINLKKVEIYELYTKEADVSIGNHEIGDEGSHASFGTENKGILINKKCS
jgi:hypothetical protein